MENNITCSNYIKNFIDSFVSCITCSSKNVDPDDKTKNIESPNMELVDNTITNSQLVQNATIVISDSFDVKTDSIINNNVINLNGSNNGYFVKEQIDADCENINENKIVDKSDDLFEDPVDNFVII